MEGFYFVGVEHLCYHSLIYFDVSLLLIICVFTDLFLFIYNILNIHFKAKVC
jgi:hypothetical protein